MLQIIQRKIQVAKKEIQTLENFSIPIDLVPLLDKIHFELRDYNIHHYPKLRYAHTDFTGKAIFTDSLFLKTEHFESVLMHPTFELMEDTSGYAIVKAYSNTAICKLTLYVNMPQEYHETLNRLGHITLNNIVSSSLICDIEEKINF